MVGVFAADPSVTLNLETEIELVNRLVITESDSYSFGTEDDEDYVSVVVDPAEFYTKDLELAIGAATKVAAHLHYKTNNPNSVEVTFNASPLINTENDTLFIPYIVEIGDSFAIVDTATATVNGSKEIYKADYTKIYQDSKTIKLATTGSTTTLADSYAAGAYSAIVTFTLTAD